MWLWTVDDAMHCGTPIDRVRFGVQTCHVCACAVSLHTPLVARAWRTSGRHLRSGSVVVGFGAQRWLGRAQRADHNAVAAAAEQGLPSPKQSPQQTAMAECTLQARHVCVAHNCSACATAA